MAQRNIITDRLGEGWHRSWNSQSKSAFQNAVNRVTDQLLDCLKTSTNETSRKNCIEATKGSSVASAKAGADVIAERKNMIQTAINSQVAKAKMGRFLALKNIAFELLKTNDIKYIYVKRKHIREWQLAAAARTPGLDGAFAASHTTSEKAYNYVRMHQKPSWSSRTFDNDEWQVIPYVFLGQLLENILDLKDTSFETGTQAKTLRENIVEQVGNAFNVDFGLVSYRSPISGGDGYTPPGDSTMPTIDDFPLYYLPISLTKLNNFFTRDVVAKERQYYSFYEFLNNLVQKFLGAAFSVCARASSNQGFTSPKVQSAVGTYGGKIQYFLYGFKNTRYDIKNGNISFGNYNSNFRNKIFHFYLGGTAKGITRSVKVTDIADENTKTAIYFDPSRSSSRSEIEPMQTGIGARSGGFPPVIFQADIETLAFPLFNMGQLIYLDLRPFITAGSGRQFKANGYYGITKVSHTFTPESFTSKINAIIQYSLEDHQHQRLTSIAAGKPVALTEDGQTISTETQSVIDSTENKAAVLQFHEDHINRYIDTLHQPEGTKDQWGTDADGNRVIDERETDVIIPTS